jgi:hypothetical protein
MAGHGHEGAGQGPDEPRRAANELANLGHEDIHGCHGHAIVVHLHVEGLDRFGVVDHNRGALIDLVLTIMRRK